jgi:hypothetical protein
MNQSLLLRCGIYRTLGDARRADEMLAEVEPRLRKDLPPGHIAFASLMAEHALNARTAGKLDSALDLINRSLTMVEATMKAGGQGVEFVPTVLMRRADIELAMKNYAAAVADGRRALELSTRDTPPGTYALRTGRLYSIVGRALLAMGHAEEARAALRSSADHLEHVLGPDHPQTRAARDLITP